MEYCYMYPKWQPVELWFSRYSVYWVHMHNYNQKIVKGKNNLLQNQGYFSGVPSKACSKRRTYHVPNLIQGVKYMISSTFATIKFGDFN